ncbi:chemotaxis protein CheD [Sinanaerobacter chloroacetimidivorans]|jgi:chemotaxis protein CheD|uniref:Probable chemoreceptor glutamine deamidase CheD n=1 Tax=Sinanaerobacter chloroacetimidivorans TaxID=2818044 RepID=A0A8J7VYP1_9FIRM|nr:chemotaxis protein CheD [Sinanaerobacter chloroacetimidivorans]MBR0597557.1 chemotaxis protein CheD [Sinanaerobacter chloroacetimidivorans]
MSELLVVGISDYKFSRNPNVLVTYALGSCIGICLYDKQMKIGGLSHIMLPESSMFSKNEINRMKFADTAIVDLIQEMRRYGANVSKLTAKIAGGAQMFEVQQGSAIGTIGDRNIKSVKSVLQSLRIPLLAEDTGLNYGRTVYFDLETGIMKVQSLSRNVKEF